MAAPCQITHFQYKNPAPAQLAQQRLMTTLRSFTVLPLVNTVSCKAQRQTPSSFIPRCNHPLFHPPHLIKHCNTWSTIRKTRPLESASYYKNVAALQISLRTDKQTTVFWRLSGFGNTLDTTPSTLMKCSGSKCPPPSKLGLTIGSCPVGLGRQS